MTATTTLTLTAGPHPQPGLTRGCTPAQRPCFTRIPFGLTSGGVSAAVIDNSQVVSDDLGDFVFASTIPAELDSVLETTYTYAVFTQVASVPEPSSLILLGLGIVGLGSYRLRRLCKG
jgi:hypothetical protein